MPLGFDDYKLNQDAVDSILKVENTSDLFEVQSKHYGFCKLFVDRYK